MLHHYRRYCAAALAAVTLACAGCATRENGFYYYEKKSFAGFDIRSLGIGKPEAETVDASALLFDPAAGKPSQSTAAEAEPYHSASVSGKAMNVYISPTLSSRVVMRLSQNEKIEVAYFSDAFWQVKKQGIFLGYCEAGTARSGSWDNYFGFLPEETGMAPNASGELVPAKSHLVDVRLYTDALEIKMKLSTNGTSIGEPFYTRNLCMLQYDTLQKLIAASERFAEDGYKIVIYDAYRPTSVQQRWFDVVRVHKWVADPSIGMGGIHDRGVAVDMTLMDKNGVELDMPTAMHTLTEASSRRASMTDAQRANVDYMTNIMVQCGFTYINSEWWHFQDSRIAEYLPTDHPIDDIPLIYMERSGQ